VEAVVTLHTDAGLTTGQYLVTRAGIGDWVDGKFVRPSPTTFTIEAGEHPETGRTDDDQPQGQETAETRTLFTDTELFTSLPSPPSGGDTGVGREADLVTIEGQFWIVTKVQHFKVISGHYQVSVQRTYVGDAS
jgi:hypothetical protein